ncbi:thiamine-phosphate kinase [Wenzhouxiangella marina]|uniref:Thiamine-monophosphate kinase n=1 Tax=Wenzhouxiangella marina TaxID=1579979 RepID=A0A0K0XY96_9GAMM|nr:thiamine-phosphate kinase [Wenzhouxiangella marina]AKS42596.1 thiamine-monophosphate kinase [Wenzhouxiangella marina]MBB6085622.1 thiamine-monophosphate kinase [Wenzhouxiangella marina]
MGEFDLIERIRARTPTDASVLVGIGDDAAVLQPDPGQALVASTDSLVPDRHFLTEWSAEDIGHLALAVNLSDLAAMGARPRWSLLALTLPEADARWLDAFLDGFLGLASAHGMRLVGGNLARGPLNICVQVLGEVEPDRVARRGRSRPGDLLAVTGTLGDAAAALALAEQAPPKLRDRLRRPTPRVAAGRVLSAWVSAMMDLSDGLLADADKLLAGTGFGAEIHAERLPASPALQACWPEAEARQLLQARGGSDYELLFSLPESTLAAAEAALDVPLSVIGRVIERPGLRLLDAHGRELETSHEGWDHFGR